MEYAEARWLTDLFNHRTHDCQLNLGQITISMESAAGSLWTVNARTPFEIASHLKFFRDTNLPLLKRGTFEMKTRADLPNPIMLEAQGRYIDPLSKLTWHEEQLARFRFFENESPSEMCLHGDFNREDRRHPLNKRPGPTLNQVITLMYAAGHNWNKINFIPPQLKPLKLVK
ncbi:MAG TPA: hypothetical protein VGD95_05975 [Micavibrio sp.]